MKYVTIIMMLLSTLNINAQTQDNISAFVSRIPSLSLTSEEAYSCYYKKEKATPLYLLIGDLDKSINTLYERSNHQSRLLSMMAKKFEDDSRTLDFTKIRLPQDAALAQLVRSTGFELSGTVNNYLRAVHQSESENGKTLKGVRLMDKNLLVYNRQFYIVLKVYKKHLADITALLDKKKWNVAKSSNPYYIQLLETEGLLLERLKNILRSFYSIQIAASDTFQYCQKNPEYCN